MDIRYKDLIKLSDGNEYVVSSMATYENEQYYYVINIHDNSIVKFLKLVYEEEQYFLEEIEDYKILLVISPNLYQNIKNDM